MKNNQMNESLVYDVPTVGKMLSLSRATVYSLVNQGIIPSIRLGKRIVVSKLAIQKMLENGGIGGRDTSQKHTLEANK